MRKITSDLGQRGVCKGGGMKKVTCEWAAGILLVALFLPVLYVLVLIAWLAVILIFKQ